MKRLIFAAVVATLSLTSASAFANCWFNGRVTHLIATDSQNYSTVYIDSGSFNTYFRVSNSQPQLMDIVRTAAITGGTLSGWGDIAICAPTGTNRYAGYLGYAYLYTG